MGTDHRGQGQVAKKLEWGDTNANFSSPDSVIGTKRSVLWPVQNTPNPFSAGALPWTPLGDLRTLPRTPYSHATPFGTGTEPPSVIGMRPPEFRTDLCLRITLLTILTLTVTPLTKMLTVLAYW